MTRSMAKLYDAYCDGVKAGTKKTKVLLNPYKPGSRRAWAWQYGHDQGECLKQKEKTDAL
jgi:hypothetical protein